MNRTFDAIAATSTPPSPDEFEQIVWAAIDTAFSEPVTPSDDVADYAATQTLAELFRNEGYDGIAYKSAFGAKAFSVALFDLDCAKQLNGQLHSAESVEFKFSKNPCDQYFINDDGNEVRVVITDIRPIPDG